MISKETHDRVSEIKNQSAFVYRWDIGYSYLDVISKARYFSWKKGSDISTKPEIVIKGFEMQEGHGLGSSNNFYFKNGDYLYQLVGKVEGSDDAELQITKNGKVIFKEPCVKEKF